MKTARSATRSTPSSTFAPSPRPSEKLLTPVSKDCEVEKRARVDHLSPESISRLVTTLNPRVIRTSFPGGERKKNLSSLCGPTSARKDAERRPRAPDGPRSERRDTVTTTMGTMTDPRNLYPVSTRLFVSRARHSADATSASH